MDERTISLIATRPATESSAWWRHTCLPI